jgi:hypothetical protein
MPQYWVSESDVINKIGPRDQQPWFLALADVTSATNWRTVVPTALPYSAVGNNAPVLLVDRSVRDLAPCLLACLSSLALDYVARFKVGGNHLNFFIVEQLPLLTPQAFRSPTPWETRVTVSEWVIPRVLELVYTAVDMKGFALELGYESAPFEWSKNRRNELRSELDAAFFHLYGLARDEVELALDSFPILQRKDQAEYGEYLTKRALLEDYDRLHRATTLATSATAATPAS